MREMLKRFIGRLRVFLARTFHSSNENLPYYISILIALVLFALGLNVFIELTDELAENELGGFDRAVTDFVLSFRSSGLTSFFTFMTDMGDRVAYTVITVSLGAYFFIRHRSWQYILQTLLVLSLSTISNIVLKRIINRQRPAIEHLVTVDTLSFPSGHAMAAMAFYGFLVYLVTRGRMPGPVRVALISVLGLMIVAIGASRIYLGVHFPSDVAAGFAGGLIWVALCVTIFNVIDLARKRKKEKSESIVGEP